MLKEKDSKKLKEKITLKPLQDESKNTFKALLASPEECKKNLQKIQVDNLSNYLLSTFDKMSILLEKYEISQKDESRWFFLSLKLAQEHIKGFQVAYDKKIVTKKKSWTICKKMELIKEVFDKQKQNPNHSISSICDILSKNGDSKFFGEKSLKQRYSESIQNRFGALYKDLLKVEPLLAGQLYQAFIKS